MGDAIICKLVHHRSESQNKHSLHMQVASGQGAGILFHTELQGMPFRFSEESTGSCILGGVISMAMVGLNDSRLREARQRMLHRMHELS